MNGAAHPDDLLSDAGLTPTFFCAGEALKAMGPARERLPEIPGFEILAELGRGGMGVVYKARQTSLKRLVALKMILAGAYAEPAVQARLRVEAEAIARLQHANIVRIYHVGMQDGRPFLALEYVDGGTLEAKVAGTQRPAREVAQLVETLARAMHYTHEHGILHRDLKPNNILLTADGTPKITDFGLAKLRDAEGGVTQTHALLGTPNYMPPEQAAGDAKNVGVPADVYSLGAILYELLTGRPPFQGTTLLKTLDQVRYQEPVSPRRLHGGIAPELETICLRCLEKEPASRYQTAELLADDLHRFLTGESIRAKPVAAWRRIGRWARRRPALVAGALAAVLLACLTWSAFSYFGVQQELERRQADDHYQEFLQHRDEAYLCGLLNPQEGALFLGAETSVNLRRAEAAARRALALAGIDPDAGRANMPSAFSPARNAECCADCYGLLLVLARVRGDQGGKDGAQESLRILDRAAHLAQTRSLHLRRCHFLEQLGKTAEAQKARAQASALPPDSAMDHFLTGEVSYRRGYWEDAREAFSRAVTLQPGHFWARFFLSVCHLKSQRWEAAKEGLNGCISQQPEFVWAYLFRSFANEKLQRLDEAEADFRKAIQLNPDEDARYVLHLTRGILRFNQKEWDQAAMDFRAAQALKPDQYNAYLNLAQVYLAQRQFAMAGAEMERALERKPPTEVVVGYNVERARRLLREDKAAEALGACQAALELRPDALPAHEIGGRALLALGRFEHAETALDQFLALGGKASADTFLARGQARMKLGKYADAVDDYTRALEMSPTPEIFQHRGWAHFFADAWKLALRDFARAIELDPEAGDAYTGRGLTRVMLGDYRAAVADADLALERKPATPEMMHNVACIFALAAARVTADSAEAKRDSLAADLRRRAVLAIRHTLQMLNEPERAAFWRAKIDPDPALDPVRDDPAFREIRAAFAAPAGRK